MDKLSHLDKRAQKALDSLVRDIAALCKENLLSIYLYGSATGKGYIPGKSNLNTLIVLKEIDVDGLKGIAGLYRKKLGSGIVAPLVLAPDYIKSSTDVFPIEFLDIKANSILLSGGDTLKDIHVDLSNLRWECERKIKAHLIRMRGSFIEVEGDKKGMETLIVTAVTNLIFSLKNILRLTKQEIPDAGEEVIKACCKTLNVIDTPFLEAWSIKKGSRKVSTEDLYDVVSGYLDSVEDIADKIDALKSEGRL